VDERPAYEERRDWYDDPFQRAGGPDAGDALRVHLRRRPLQNNP
jgi:hypothetical protein